MQCKSLGCDANSELGRGGLEPPTHGFSVRCPDAISDCDETTYNSDDPPSATESAILIEKWPDLASVVTAWPDLPEPVRAGIAAMVKASTRDAPQSPAAREREQEP